MNIWYIWHIWYIWYIWYIWHIWYINDTKKIGGSDPLYNKQLENSKLQLDDTQKSEDLQLVEYLLSNIEPDVFGDAISSLRNDNTLDRIILHATREDAKLLSSKIKKMSNS